MSFTPQADSVCALQYTSRSNQGLSQTAWHLGGTFVTELLGFVHLAPHSRISGSHATLHCHLSRREFSEKELEEYFHPERLNECLNLLPVHYYRFLQTIILLLLLHYDGFLQISTDLQIVEAKKSRGNTQKESHKRNCMNLSLIAPDTTAGSSVIKAITSTLFSITNTPKKQMTIIKFKIMCLKVWPNILLILCFSK